MSIASRLAEFLTPKATKGATRAPLSFDDYLSYFKFGGAQYGVPMFSQTLQGSREEIDRTYEGLVEQAYKSNGIVFACMRARQSLFSEARFRYRRMRNGKPGDLFGDRSLRILDTPWPGGSTGDLLSIAITDLDVSGNAFLVRVDGGIRRLRPSWVDIIAGTELGGVAVDPIGYIYHPNGRSSGREPVTFLPETVAHWKFLPDPTGQFRGMSWLMTILREIAGDSATTDHKLKYFENGATPNLAITLDASVTLEDAREWIALFEQNHTGTLNAYKTLFLGGGSKPVPVGSDLSQIDFKSVQGAGETRIAAAAGVPPIIVGLSEGLASATYSNYGQARRAFADLTMRPLWRSFAGALGQIIDVPADAELWYDDSDISFLQEDMKDAAEILGMKVTALGVLVRDGWTPDSAKLYVASGGDLSILEHTGLFSVQLQPPMPEGPPVQLEAKPVERPLLTSGRSVPTFEVRCTGARKDGTPCGALILKRPGPDPVGVERKCDRCGAFVAA
jgi:phage portal protein BeeE